MKTKKKLIIQVCCSFYRYSSKKFIKFIYLRAIFDGISEDGDDRVYNHEKVREPNRPVHVHIHSDKSKPEMTAMNNKDTGKKKVHEAVGRDEKNEPNDRGGADGVVSTGIKCNL